MGGVLTDDDGERLLYWLTRSPGRELVAQERQYVEELFADLSGCYLLQIGWGRAFYAPIVNKRIKRRIILEECFPLMGGTGKVLGRANALPIASNAVDAVFLPHTLEFTNFPRQVLQEADRVLIPGGHLVLLGFNPLSIWGSLRLVKFRSKSIPWCGRFIGLQKITKWLACYGFEIEKQNSIMFLPPFHQTSLLSRLSHIDRAMEQWMPMNGVVYIVRAVKRMPIITPLEPLRACDSRPLIASAFESSTRGILNG